MSLLSRKRIIAAKIETTYGVDPTPAGSNAILVRNVNITPQDADFASRDLIRPYLGNSESLPAGIRTMIDFEVELQSSGTAGTAPSYGVLLRSCGFSETINASPIAGTAQAGSTTTTIVLATGASAVDGFYNGMPISTTGGTGSGQNAAIISYVGSTKTATIGSTWTVTPDATTTYSIGANVVYRPVSASFESSTLYFNVDGVLHKLTGARGTVSMSAKVKAIPVFKFTLTGVYNTVTDTAALSPVYTGFKTPLPVTNINTPQFALHGFAGVMSDLSIDLANSIVHRTLVGGAEAVLLTNRDASGSITVEAGTVASKDWFTLAKNATLGTFSITHGVSTGYKMLVSSGQVQLTKPTYTDMDGVQMLQMGIDLVPSTLGNDELFISAF